FMIMSMLLPGQVLMIPQYIIWNNLGLVGTYVPLILPKFLGAPFFIYMMMQFIKGLPKELDEAAMIDGCSRYQIFTRIILPLLGPSIITTVVIQFYWVWDDYMGPLLYLTKPSMYTVSLAIKNFADVQGTNFGPMFAMSTLSLIPVFLLFLFFNRYLMDGVTAGSVKG
ncbi:MAG: carbohydrate ABC transporter permease, partial [Clostridiales bacterium]|nr:carbohydrate ABC transporter permease [Clostridiales bacterium]